MWNASPEWKHLVLEAMEANGISRAELSRRIGVTDAAITVLFRATTRQSRLVPQINRVVGLPEPTQATVPADGELAELIKIWRELDDAGRKALIAVAELAARSKR